MLGYVGSGDFATSVFQFPKQQIKMHPECYLKASEVRDCSQWKLQHLLSYLDATEAQEVGSARIQSRD